jgi:catechol 2,3-dioxygenase-like lactoylglutathione lyase family enzyme
VIDRLDHLVLTTAHEEACVRFYTQVLGMQLETFSSRIRSVYVRDRTST